MPQLHSVFSIFLDVAPLGWAPLFLLPVLIIGIVMFAAAILVHTIRRKKKDKQEGYNDKDSDSTKQ